MMTRVIHYLYNNAGFWKESIQLYMTSFFSGSSWSVSKHCPLRLNDIYNKNLVYVYTWYTNMPYPKKCDFIEDVLALDDVIVYT